jgi:hypothetical protein
LMAGEAVVRHQLVGGIPLRLSPFPAGPFRHPAFPFIWVCEGYRRGSVPVLLQIRKGVWQEWSAALDKLIYGGLGWLDVHPLR